MTPSTGHALIVEDDSSWQQILGELLMDMGLKVEIAGNLEDGLRIVKSHTHCLAIVDLSLSESDHSNSDGLRILETIRNLDPFCQTILLTGFATVELAVSALTDYGAFTFLRKENFHRSQFLDIAKRALAVAPPANNPNRQVVGPVNSVLMNFNIPEDSRNRILVVEDDVGWRNILNEILADAGHAVQTSASFGEAFGYLRRDEYDLVVIDLSLTGSYFLEEGKPVENLEGIQLLTYAKSIRLPTIVVSGVTSTVEIQRAYEEHSIFAYLEKQTFDRNTFRNLVAEACISKKRSLELDCLTDREREVFVLLVTGKSNKEIARDLVVSTNTVKRHLKSIFKKLEVHTRSAAAARVIDRPI